MEKQINNSMPEANQISSAHSVIPEEKNLTDLLPQGFMEDLDNSFYTNLKDPSPCPSSKNIFPLKKSNNFISSSETCSTYYSKISPNSNSINFNNLNQKNDSFFKNNESQYYSTKMLTQNYSLNENRFCNNMLQNKQQQYFSQNMLPMQNQNLYQMNACQMKNRIDQMKNANLNNSTNININMINNMLIVPEYQQENSNNFSNSSYSNISEENNMINDNNNNFLYKRLVNNYIKNYYQNSNDNLLFNRTQSSNNQNFYNQTQNFNINNNSINNLNKNFSSISLNTKYTPIQQNQNEDKKNSSNTELSDAQISSFFSDVFSLNAGGSQILYAANKKGPKFFVKIIKSHKGSKFLQKILNNNKPKEYEINYLTNIICQNLYEIICDYYGNYFLQKFFPFCSYKNRLEFYKYIKPHFMQIADDICGNHSLQCLILLQSSNEEKNIIKSCVEDNLDFLCYNQKSSHVIQQIIKSIKENERDYLNNYIISNLINLCLNAHGICIVKEFINNIKKNFYIKHILYIFELAMNKLTFSQFGNFGIQEVIKVFGLNNCNKLVDNLIENFFEYSTSKYSSNVICFLLQTLKNNNITFFIETIHKVFFKDYLKMIKNKHSIFVIFTVTKLIIELYESAQKDTNTNFNVNSISDSEKDNSINILNNIPKIESESSDSEKNEDNEELKDKGCEQEIIQFYKEVSFYINENTPNKEKKKLINLLKMNKIQNYFLVLKKKKDKCKDNGV